MSERVCNRGAFIPQNAIFEKCGINGGSAPAFFLCSNILVLLTHEAYILTLRLIPQV